MSFIPFTRLTPLHSGYTAAVGRAVVVCQHMEDCAHHVMVTYELTDAMDQGASNLQDAREIARKLRGTSLGRSVQKLKASGDFGNRAEILELGRQARNWLVHEAADVIETGYSVSGVLSRVPEFAEKVNALCYADRIVSVASYEICEREPVWSSCAEDYEANLRRWIMEPIIEGIGLLAEQEPAGMDE